MRQVPILSFSGASLYKKCGAAYYESYINPERRLNKPTGDMTGTIPGKVVHKITERAFVSNRTSNGEVLRVDEHKFKDRKLLYAIFKDELEKQPFAFIGERDTEDPSLEWAKSEKAALEALTTWRDNLYNAIKIHNLIQPYMLREWWFGSYNNPLILNDQLKMCGAIDLFTAKDKTSPGRLVDYKAANSDYRLDKDQLKFYWIASKARGLNIGMAAFLIFKRKAPPAYERFKDEELKESTERFVQISKDIQAEKFEYNPSRQACYLCKHRDQCPKVFPFETPQPKPKKLATITRPPHEIPEL